MTTVSPAAVPVSESSNLTVTMMTGWPGVSRRLRAIAGCGGHISTLAAPAGTSFSINPSEENGWPASGPSGSSAPSSGSRSGRWSAPWSALSGGPCR
ncbi:MAG: hypothetical protein ACRDOB_04350 [Streptosporangiaceae bacterium]